MSSGGGVVSTGGGPVHKEGYLQKHVNALKGYQLRFFVISLEQGRLDYYLTKEAFDSSPKDYRGCIPLAGAEVAPREEDSVSFNVFSTSGESFQLKAETAKDRQKWVDGIRWAVQKYNEAALDPLAVRKSITDRSRALSGNKKKKAQSAPSSKLILPTKEMVNTREAINAAEKALDEMSEIIAAYPLKRLPLANRDRSGEDEQQQQHLKRRVSFEGGTTTREEGQQDQHEGGATTTTTPSEQQDNQHEDEQNAVNYEAMLNMKAFSVACLKDLELCFEAVRAEYVKQQQQHSMSSIPPPQHS